MKINKIILLLLICAVVPMLNSCGYVDFKGSTVNQFGGSSRANNYENFKEFFKYTSNTIELKTKDTSGISTYPMSLASDKMVCANFNGSVMMFTGDLLWETKLDPNSIIGSAMCADPEQNIYMIDTKGKVYSLSDKGKIRWKSDCFESKSLQVFSDLLCLKDGIIAADNYGTLIKLSFDGKLLWKKEFGLDVLKAFPADKNDNIIIPLSHNEFGLNDTLMILNSQGNIVRTIDAKGRITCSPIVYDDKIYCGVVIGIGENKTSKICEFDVNSGKMNGSTDIQVMPRYLSAVEDGSVIGVGIYAGLQYNVSMIYCINKDHKVEWLKYSDQTVASPVLVGRKSLAYVGLTDNTTGLYFIDKEKGNYMSVLSYSNYPNLMPFLAYRPDGALVMGGSEKFVIVKSDESFFSKLLPW